MDQRSKVVTSPGWGARDGSPGGSLSNGDLTIQGVTLRNRRIFNPGGAILNLGRSALWRPFYPAMLVSLARVPSTIRAALSRSLTSTLTGNTAPSAARALSLHAMGTMHIDHSRITQNF